MHNNAHDHPDTPAQPPDQRELDLMLTGRLPCITCGYDLQGISIRGACPECGVAVRATILNKVDPEADEFKPLLTPRLTAIGLVAWAVSGFLAAMAIWAMRVVEMLHAVSAWFIRADWAVPVLFGMLAVSFLSVATLLRPVRQQSWWKTLAACAAMAAYIPLAWILFHIHTVVDEQGVAPYFGAGPQADRALLRVQAALCLAAMFLAIRPNARDLVRRCMAMRTGRVGRQTLLAMVAALGLASVGDLLTIWASVLPSTSVTLIDGLLYVGRLLVLIGSLLLTLGLYHVVLDTIRIGAVLLRPPPTLEEVLG